VQHLDVHGVVFVSPPVLLDTCQQGASVIPSGSTIRTKAHDVDWTVDLILLSNPNITHRDAQKKAGRPRIVMLTFSDRWQSMGRLIQLNRRYCRCLHGTTHFMSDPLKNCVCQAPLVRLSPGDGATDARKAPPPHYLSSAHAAVSTMQASFLGKGSHDDISVAGRLRGNK